MNVSINTYQDAPLLRECLASIRCVAPDARIQVVDGAYSTFPHDSDNSTDGTPEICDDYDAEYWPVGDGPYADEPAKHRARVRLAPDGDPVLFMDADERLVAADPAETPTDTVGRVRIYDPVYRPGVTYYARYFRPEWLVDIPRQDRFWFERPDGSDLTERHTDAITIVHRHDLRGDAYVDAKAARLDSEGRDPERYRERVARARERATREAATCPSCGEDTLHRSRVGGYAAGYTRVEACVSRDGCHRAVVGYDLGDYEYLPDRIREGFREDPERLRVECMDAGLDMAGRLGPGPWRRYEPNVRQWARRRFGVDNV